MYEFVAASESPSTSKAVDTTQIKEGVAEVIDDKMQSLENQLGEMTKVIENFSYNVKSQNAQDDEELKDFYEFLIKSGIHQGLAVDLCGAVKELMLEEQLEKDVAISKALTNHLGSPNELALNENGQTVVVMLGPTGVGKTTSLAKLAATFSLQKNLNAAFITADVYRIGAVEQLKTYADIMGIPMEVIPNVDEVSEALRRHAEADIIFIDTPGKSPSDDQHSLDMQRLIEISGASNVFLVVSATSNVESLKRIFKTYENIEDYKLIVTKTDEAMANSTLFNVADLSKNSISYLAFGQNVPNDIKVIDANETTQSLLQDLTSNA